MVLECLSASGNLDASRDDVKYVKKKQGRGQPGGWSLSLRGQGK
jgi:hypothetical protein